MKKLYYSLILSALSLYGIAQEFTVTTDGLRDAQDLSKSFVVIKADGIKSNNLYKNAVEYVIKNYTSPDDVIKGQIEGEYFKFITYVPNFLYVRKGSKIWLDANFTIELNFKDNKVKFEVIALDIHTKQGNTPFSVIYSGSSFKGYQIYNKKGQLVRPDTKEDIENYFNAFVNSLAKGLVEEDSKDNEDW